MTICNLRAASSAPRQHSFADFLFAAFVLLITFLFSFTRPRDYDLILKMDTSYVGYMADE